MKIQLVTSNVTVQLLDLLQPECGGGQQEGFLKKSHHTKLGVTGWRVPSDVEQ